MTPSKPVRNPATALTADWLDDLGPRLADVDTRAAVLDRTPEPRAEAEMIVGAIEVLDLTSLNDSDTVETIHRLCARAVRPLPLELAARISTARDSPKAAAVCVHDRFVPAARSALQGHGVLTASVTAGFPWPHEDLQERIDEVHATVEAGAEEVDLVIDRRHAQAEAWEALYGELRALRDACGDARMKAILAAGDLGSHLTVAKASLVCCMAGVDFIKTSTGREAVNATLPVGLAMAAAIRSYADRTGYIVGLKAAGGIRSSRQAWTWLELVREGLGPEWLTPDRFRIGASTLLDDMVQSLKALR